MIEIDGRKIGAGHPAFVIAEVGQAHDGSLGIAHSYIDMAAEAGANAVKFQTHIAEEESTPDEPWRVKFSYQDASRFDYWRRMEFTEEQWGGLASHARDRGLTFLSSPFSLMAVELLSRIGVPAWKIASGEITNLQLLEATAKSQLPVILSSGMSTLEELDTATALLQKQNASFAVLQCYTAYPCPPEKIGVNMMEVYRERYDCPSGLSDHSGTIYAGLAAVSLGANILELHITASKGLFGPDVPASVTPEELRMLVDGVRFIESMIASPVSKEDCAKELSEMRRLFSKSIVARSDLSSGTILTGAHLALKKPGTGMHADRIQSLLGKTLKVDVKKDQFLQESDIS